MTGGAVPLLATALLLRLAPLVGQEPPAVRSGERVRVTAPSVAEDAVVGTIVEARERHLVLDPTEPESLAGTPRTIAWEDIAGLERSAGTRSYALLGTLIGLGAGGVTGTVWWNLIKEADDDAVINGYALGGGAAAGALLGLGVGLLLRSERWSEVSLTSIRAGASEAGGGLSASVGVRF